jgi:hypothetical protein
MGNKYRRNQRNSADASATTVQNIPDAPDISLNDVSFTSMTVHMETVYAADKNVTSFDVSWNPHDGAMDSSDASNVYITGLDEATEYTFYGWAEFRRNQRKLGGCQCTTYRISIPRYFAQRRVFHFHDCTWRRLRRRQECRFDVSWNPRTVHG